MPKNSGGSSNRDYGICRDGSITYATGRGAGSHHGGVAQWVSKSGSSSSSSSWGGFGGLSSSSYSSSPTYYSSTTKESNLK